MDGCCGVVYEKNYLVADRRCAAAQRELNFSTTCLCLEMRNNTMDGFIDRYFVLYMLIMNREPLLLLFLLLFAADVDIGILFDDELGWENCWGTDHRITKQKSALRKSKLNEDVSE